MRSFYARRARRTVQASRESRPASPLLRGTPWRTVAKHALERGAQAEQQRSRVFRCGQVVRFAGIILKVIKLFTPERVLNIELPFGNERPGWPLLSQHATGAARLVSDLREHWAGELGFRVPGDAQRATWK